MRRHGGQGFFADLTTRIEMLLILEAVFACKGNKMAASKILGMSYSAISVRYYRFNQACAKAAAKFELAERSRR